MNKHELADLVREWMHAPASDRPNLDAAIDELYRKAKESLWRGLEEDDFDVWLMESLRSDTDDEEVTSDLENSVAEYLDSKAKEQASVDLPVPDVRAAAYKLPADPRQQAHIPDDAKIREDVLRILRKIDSGE